MRNRSKIHNLIMITLAFMFCSSSTACSNVKNLTKNIEQSTKSNGQVLKAKSSTNVSTIEQTVKSSISIPTIQENITILCSDEFEGRRTFSKGNEQAGEYIADIFKNIGLEPMSGDSYFQKYTQSEPASKDYAATSKEVNNIVGYIKGKDGRKAVVISAHFDSLGIKEGNINRGALDNASGVAALVEIAKKLKEISMDKPFQSNIIFCAFNGEEELYRGSTAFVEQSKSKSWYKNMYNINIDCIGAKDGGKFVFPKDSKFSQKLYDAVKNSMNKNGIDFIGTKQILGSDHRSFEKAEKANLNIAQENLRKWANKSIDVPDILDYAQIEKIASALCDFVKSNDEIMY